MHFLKLVVVFSLTLIMSACGGGGSGDANSSQVISSNSTMSTIGTSGSSSSVMSVSSAAATSASSSSGASTIALSLDKSELNFSAAITGSAPSPIGVTGTIANLQWPAYLVLTGFAPLVDPVGAVLIDNEQATINFTPVDPGFLTPGMHSEIINVRVCKDVSCVEEYPGSLKTITVNYEVTAPTFTISNNQVTFDITDNQATLPSTVLTFTSSEQAQITDFSVYTFNADGFPDWLHTSTSWSGTSGSMLVAVTKNLTPGTYTANLGTYLFKFPLSHRIDVTVNVTSGSASSSSSSSSSASCNGDLFVESVCTTQWRPVSIFEQHKINSSDFQVIGSSSGKVVTATIIDSGDVAHGQVLDVKYNANASYYGHVAIESIDIVKGQNMSEYLNGELTFDVKVISKGDANANLNVKVECQWPCQSNLHEVSVPSLNTWVAMEIPIADLVAEGLNLERISNGFIIFPDRNFQSNAHFQIDNVRWVK